MQPALTPAPGLVLVHIPDRYPTSVALAGGHRLYFDASYETEKHKLITATVLRVGLLDDRYQPFDTPVGPIGLSAVRDALAPGDTVFVDYLDVDDSTQISPGVYALQYPSLLARLAENDVLVPLGGKVLLKPIWPAGTGLVRLEDCNVPVRFNPDGSLTAVPDNVSQWETPPLRPLEYEGIVRWVGTPLAGLPGRFTRGQRVTFPPGYGWIVTMLTTDYLVMPQHVITGIYAA